MTARAGLLEEDRVSIAQGLSSRAESLRGAHILVTGASGFFGRWLVDALTVVREQEEIDIRLTLVARDAAKLKELAAALPRNLPVSCIATDVRALHLGEQPTHVIHCAASASAHLNETNPDEMISVIVDGTRRVLAAAAGAKHVLFVSSGAVYGPTAGLFPQETSLLGPNISDARSAYGEAKRLAELSCVIDASRTGRSVTIARGFAFVGPHLPLETHFAMGNFLRDALAGRKIVVHGDGSPVRSYMHTVDLVCWLIAILVDGTPGRAYNVGSDMPVTIADVARVVGSQCGVDVEIRGAPVTGVSSAYVPSIARITSELGVAVTIPFEQAVERTVRWLRRGQ